MKQTPSTFLPSVFSALLIAASTSAGNENWPQWRGPSATGTATDARPPLEWSETKNVRWKVEVPGSGTGTPVIWGDQIFIQTAVP
ncbi:MAG TPA: hypothetical protein VK633_07070, partial [Verrucomicrobiae bacterium]|nr:hypothetical protein [Verrucomicrobiae bacterium]